MEPVRPSEADIRRPKESIQADLQKVEVQKNSVAEKGDKIFGALTEPQQQAFGQIVEQKTAHPEAPLMVDPSLQAAVALYDEYAAVEQEEAKLQKEYLPYKREEVQELCHKLASQLQLASLLKFHEDTRDNGILANSLSEVAFLKMAQAEDPNAADFHRLTFIEDTLTQYQQEWTEKGFLQDQAKPFESTIPPEQVTDVKKQIIEQIDIVVDNLETFDSLSSTYRPSFEKFVPRTLNLHDIQRVLQFDENDPSNKYQQNIKFLRDDPQFIEEAAYYLQAKTADYAAQGMVRHTPEERDQYVQKRRTEASQRGSALNFKGFEPSEGREVVVTPEYVQQEIEKIVPTPFLRGIDSITATKNTREQKDPNVETIGSFFPKYDTDGKYVSGAIEVYFGIHKGDRQQQYQEHLDKVKFGEVENGDETWLKSEFVSVVAHEIGHRIHYELTLDEMLGWEATVENDPVNVSEYVSRTRARDKMLAKKEDFAESFKLFTANPAMLLAYSPDRFRYFHAVVSSYLDAQETERLNAALVEKINLIHVGWRMQGVSPEQASEMLRNQAKSQ